MHKYFRLRSDSSGSCCFKRTVIYSFLIARHFLSLIKCPLTLRHLLCVCSLRGCLVSLILLHQAFRLGFKLLFSHLCTQLPLRHRPFKSIFLCSHQGAYRPGCQSAVTPPIPPKALPLSPARNRASTSKNRSNVPVLLLPNSVRVSTTALIPRPLLQTRTLLKNFCVSSRV
jgi:hypothetical protein